MYIEHETKNALRKRIKRLAGQITGIEKMLRQNRDASDVLILLLSAQGSFNSLSAILDGCFRMHINVELNTPRLRSYIRSETLTHIDSIRVQLSTCSTKQLLRIIYTVRQLKNNQ